MNKRADCPDIEQLEKLLSDATAEAEQHELATHLESCDACRQRLEELAGRVEMPAENPDPSAAVSPRLRNLIENLTVPPTKTTVMNEMPESEPSIDFLDPPRQPDQLGRLGEYEITEVIGHGGMGIVLKGHDPRLNRFVAIKVLSPQLASNVSARQRFLREAQKMAAVTHDHVVAIHAIDEAKGLPFIVMEYIMGVSLEGRIEADGSLKVEEILRVGMQAASGLAAAHAQGLVHRDIKPSNILLENGIERVKITDFGLARAADDAQITQTGVVTGTPQYMSPEQARGELVDQRSDLFSLGCVLYAMCTGRSPFRADTVTGAIHRVCNDTPRPVQEINPDVPKWLVAIVDRLLAKDPRERFQSANEVAKTLEGYLAHVQQPSMVQLPVASTYKAPPPKKRPGSRRRKIAAAALATCLCVGVVGLFELTGITRFWADLTMPTDPLGFGFVDLRGVSTMVLRGSTDRPMNDLRELPTGVHTFADVPFFITDGYVRLDSDKGRIFEEYPPAVEGIRIGRYAERLHFLQGVQHVGGSGVTVAKYTVHYLDGSSEEIPVVTGKHLWDWWLNASRPPVTEGYEAWLGSNPAQRLLSEKQRAFFGRDLGLALFRMEWVNPHPEKKIRTIDFSRVSSASPFCVAITCQDDESVGPPEPASPSSEVAGLDIHVPIEGVEVGVSSGISSRRFRQDDHIELPFGTFDVAILNLQNSDTSCLGSLTISEGSSRRIDVIDDCNLYPPLDPQPSAQAELLGFTGPVLDIALSAKGRTLATLCGNSLKLWQAAELGFKEQATLKDHNDTVTTMAVCPRGHTLASANHDGVVILTSLETEEERLTFPSPGVACTSIAFSPDGDTLATAYADGTVSFWKSDTGERVGGMAAHEAEILSIAFSPDGTALATSCVDATIKIWDMATTDELQTIYGHSDAVESIAFLPDGKKLVSASRDTTVKLWNIDSGRMVDSYVNRGRMLCVAVSSDGNLVAAAGTGQVVRIWNVSDGKGFQLQSEFHAHWSEINSILFCENDRSLLTASSDHSVKVWGVKAVPAKPGPALPQPKTTFASHRKRTGSTMAWRMGSGASMAFTTDGELMATTDTHGQVYVWRLKDLRKIADFDLGEYLFYDTLAFTPDDKTLVVCSMSKLHCWDRATGELRLLVEYDTGSTNLAISPDGNTIITTHLDGLSRFWDFHTGESQGETRSPFGRPSAVAISPQESEVLVGTATGEILRLNPTTHEAQGESLRHGVGIIETIVYFQDGSRVATSSLLGGTVKIWDAVSWQEITTLTGHKGCIQRITASPDGTKLVASGGAGTREQSPAKSLGYVTIWDLTNNDTTPVAQFAAHLDSTVAVAFSPDGKTLATTGRDGKFHLWDVDLVMGVVE